MSDSIAISLRRTQRPLPWANDGAAGVLLMADGRLEPRQINANLVITDRVHSHSSALALTGEPMPHKQALEALLNPPLTNGHVGIRHRVDST